MAGRKLRLIVSAVVFVSVVVALLIVVGGGRTSPKTVTSAVPTCLRQQLRVAFVGVSGGLGHEGNLIKVTNLSDRVCSLTGYPSVIGVFTSGVQKQFKDTADGYLGGFSTKPLNKVKLPVVRLRARHGIATSMEESVLRQTCPGFTSYIVTLPHVTGGTYTFHVHWLDRYCFQPEVHPFLPGSTGSVNLVVQ
jgi:hypothetical protein